MLAGEPADREGAGRQGDRQAWRKIADIKRLIMRQIVRQGERPTVSLVQKCVLYKQLVRAVGVTFHSTMKTSADGKCSG